MIIDNKHYSTVTQYKTWVVFLLFLLLPILVYIRYPMNGLMLVSGDGLGFINASQFYTNNIMSGEFAVWNKYLCAGSPSVASAYIYPPNLILGFLPPEWYIYFLYCIHLGIGAFFLHLYLREIECNNYVSLIVAVVYMFSIHIAGYRKSHMMLIVAIVMLPIAMYLIQKHINSKRLIYLVLAAIPISMGFLGGHSQTALYIAAVVFAYYVIIAIIQKTKPSVFFRNIALFVLTAIGLTAIMLLPTAEIMYAYAQHGSIQADYNTFTSYSIHPFKLIQMIFPYFFGDQINQYGSFTVSSEMDIELFIGVVALIMVVFSIKISWKNAFIKISIAFCALAFCYAAIAHIPILRDFVYRIPVLGTFRVPSRSLPVFIFFLYVIMAIGLTNLAEPEMLERFMLFERKTAVWFSISCASMLTAVFTLARVLDNEGYTLQIIIFNWAKQAIAPIVAVVVVFAVIVCIVIRLKRFRYTIFVFLFLATTLFETLPFAMKTQAANADAFGITNPVVNDFLSDIGNYKIIDAFPGIDGAHQSIISLNKSMALKIPSINAYITYNNPVLYRMLAGGKETEAPLNYSGLLTGFFNAHNLIIQNDLLSMLGVKYVIDNSYFIPDEGLNENLAADELIYEWTGETVLEANTVSVWGDAVQIEPNSYYYVTLEYESDASLSGSVYIDFYAENYDFPECDTIIDTRQYQSDAVIFSSDSSQAKGDIFIRLISLNRDEPLILRNFRLFTTIQGNGFKVYEPYFIDESNRIFINTNARDILYFSDEVQGIENIEDIVTNPVGLQLDKISYIVGASDTMYDTWNGTIENIDFKNNSITATVQSEKEQFVNFSQCYFPGWRVYVNGERADLKVVNALIMGIEVPAGTNTVTFKYLSISFICGLAITCITILFWILYFIIRKRRKAKQIETNK